MPRPSTAVLLALSSLAGTVANAADTPANTVNVTVTDKGCVPNTLTVPAGKIVFRIKNDSRRALEWEILKGVAVVAERENIVPGFTQPLTATLSPGEYQMTCGLLSNAKGTLTVTGDAQQTAHAPADLAAPIAAYRTYVQTEADALVTATATFVAAVKSGNLAEAQRLYAPARVHYERIEPIAELFNDLDSSIDARADDFEKKEKDTTWTGFHHLEYVLFTRKTTDGLAPAADKLAADTVELRQRLAGLELPPKDVVGGAAELIEEVASKKISGEEDRYSHTDLWDFQANTDGAQKIFVLLKPLLSDRDPQLVARVEENFAKVDKTLAKYKAGDGFEPYDKLSGTDKNTLKRSITALAEDLSKLRGTLGVD
jgi:iron uptake system component EfeO